MSRPMGPWFLNPSMTNADVLSRLPVAPTWWQFRPRQLLGHWGKLCLREGVVCRSVHDPVTHDAIFQVVVPRTQVQSLLQAYHTQIGHQGQLRTLSLLRRNFYLKMEEFVQAFIQGCPRCMLFKAR